MCFYGQSPIYTVNWLEFCKVERQLLMFFVFFKSCACFVNSKDKVKETILSVSRERQHRDGKRPGNTSLD